MGSITEQGDDIPTYPPSLQVPNVQEMVLKDPLDVPERYIRNEEEMQTKTDLSHLSSQVPVIDLSLLSNGDKEEYTCDIYIYIYISVCVCRIPNSVCDYCTSEFEADKTNA